MRELSSLKPFPLAEQLVTVLQNKTQSTDPLFFRVMVSYYFTKVASMMHCNIKTHDRGVIPVNVYAINLANSGHGKGFSTNIVEEHVINQFRTTFIDSTLPLLAEKNLAKLSVKRAIKKGTDDDEELTAILKEYDLLGDFAFSFDSGTSPAVKAMRHKTLMADAGSINLEMDEIGSNLMGNTEVLNTFLELFDVGKVKQKLTKNTADNKRNEEIWGRSPTNMMLFGTPTKILDGDKVETAFKEFLDIGYARRCIFGFSKYANKTKKLTPSEIYDLVTKPSDTAFLETLSNKFGVLADMANFNKTIVMEKKISLDIIEYKSYCEELASELGDHEVIKKAEISHRYFKALKLAGTYAFINGDFEITQDTWYNAVYLVEQSGKAFNDILTSEKNFVRLAKYIASVNCDITHVDLTEALPFYKGSESVKREMLTLAIAYGYKNNIIIKKSIVDGIEFLKGESLKKLDLDNITLSYSRQLSDGYLNENIPFDKLHTLTQEKGYHWVAHHVIDGHRREQNIIPGFNLCVIDVDGGVDLKTAKLLLQDYKYLLYTTKSHTDQENRFRIIFPMSHTLKMNKEDYKKFMENVYEWLPFAVDTSTKDRCRKWLSCNKSYFYNDGSLLNTLLFIPKTAKAEARKAIINDQQSLSNLERWFLNDTSTGNRSNQLIRYALMLIDAGMEYDDISFRVKDLNKKLPSPLDDLEIDTTILKSVATKINKRNIGE